MIKLVIIAILIVILPLNYFFSLEDTLEQESSYETSYSLKQENELEFMVHDYDLSITLHFPFDVVWHSSRVSTRRDSGGIKRSSFTFLFSNKQGDENLEVRGLFGRDIKISVNNKLIFEKVVDASLKGEDQSIFLQP